jgi:GxxExxY protein
MTENEISSAVLAAAIEVHKALGPGLLESVYEASLKHELMLRGLGVKEQVGLPVVYKGVTCELGYRIDLMVEGKVIVELKSVDALNDVHVAQVLTYLKLSGCRLGLLINFNVKLLKNGIRRLVNNLQEEH